MAHKHVRAILKHDNGEIGEDVRLAQQWAAGEARIEEALLGTFPASDPPSGWAGEELPGAGEAHGVHPDRVLDVSELDVSAPDGSEPGPAAGADLDPPRPGQLPR